jgi:ERCC4-type nuclease
MELIIDDREKDLVKSLKTVSFGFPYRVERISVADFQVFRGGQLVMIIERKTWKDLAASITDGRIGNNKKLDITAEKHPGCKIMYLIEGRHYDYNWFSKKGPAIGHFKIKALQSFLCNMQFKGYGVLRTENIRESIKRLEFEMASFENYAKKHPELYVEGVEGGNGEGGGDNKVKAVSISKEEVRGDSGKEIDALEFVAAIKNVSRHRAEALLQCYPMPDLMYKDRKKIIDKLALKTNPSGSLIGRKVAVKTVNNMFKFLQNEYFFRKALCAVEGLGPKGAAKIKLNDLNSKKKIEKLSVNNPVKKRLIALFVLP